MSGYGEAFDRGQLAGARWGRFAIAPFWRGRKYRRAWLHGWELGRQCCWLCGR